jgi:hypothetical protein
VVDLDPNDDLHAMIAWKFYGAGDEGDAALGRIWGIVKTVESSDEFLGDYICDFHIVLGSKAIGSGSALPQDKIWAAAIVPTVDSAAFPGVRLAAEQAYSAISQGTVQASAAPELIFAGLGYDMYIIEIQREIPLGSKSDRISPVASAGVIYRLM